METDLVSHRTMASDFFTITRRSDPDEALLNHLGTAEKVQLPRGESSRRRLEVVSLHFMAHLVHADSVTLNASMFYLSSGEKRCNIA